MAVIGINKLFIHPRLTTIVLYLSTSALITLLEDSKRQCRTRVEDTVTMSLRMLKSAISLFHKEGFSVVAEKGGEKISESFANPIRDVGNAHEPVWVSNIDFRSYCLNESEYVISQVETDQDIELMIDTTDIQSIELPIVGAEHSDSIAVSTSFCDQQVDIDKSYNYPSQIWKEVSVPESTDSVTLNVSTTGSKVKRGFLDHIPSGSNTVEGTRVGLPALYPEQPQPPIFLISIDTLSYTEQSHMQPLIDVLGPDAVIPSEPRTQGYWTAPSHASMFTGSHPGNHGYVGHGKAKGDERPIDPVMTTIPELLTNQGYKCSGLVSHTRILPEFGFGRGCHRYQSDSMGYSDWVTRDHDSRESVNRLMEWIDADLSKRDHSLFYFLHVFDPHYPYLPPFDYINKDEIDLNRPSQYREQYNEARGEIADYLRMYENDHEVDPVLVDEMEEYLSLSVEYTARQIARLVEHLRSVNLFDEALIIITGDHGEEFGERGFFTHSSLYDRNIRPFMVIKPPKSVDWSIPDAVDTIDFLPTISQLVGVDVPEHCTGVPIQTKQENEHPRITERIKPDWYNVAVEKDGTKGIFTYESHYPDRPSETVITNGPVLTEFYNLDAVRSGDFSEIDNLSNRDKLEQIAEDFVINNSPQYSSSASAVTPSQETEERLQDLGYL